MLQTKTERSCLGQGSKVIRQRSEHYKDSVTATLHEIRHAVLAARRQEKRAVRKGLVRSDRSKQQRQQLKIEEEQSEG